MLRTTIPGKGYIFLRERARALLPRERARALLLRVRVCLNWHHIQSRYQHQIPTLIQSHLPNHPLQKARVRVPTWARVQPNHCLVTARVLQAKAWLWARVCSGMLDNTSKK
jgi:hypothetical protein